MKITTKQLTFSAVFAALIFVTTAYLFHIPTGFNGGYVHLGDAFIYLAASFLPTPLACIASAVGAGLADALTGAYIWIIPTMIIKPLMAAPFSCKGPKILSKRNLLMAVIGGVICTIGYYLADVVLVGNWIAPLAGILTGLTQPVGSLVLYYVVGFALDRVGFKSKMNLAKI